VAQGNNVRTNIGLVRLLEDGSLDPTFALPPATQPAVLSLAIQPDAKVLVANSYLVQRLNADGTEDTTFKAVGLDPTPYAGSNLIAVEADGNILVGGRTIQRMSGAGTPDLTFRAAFELYGVGTILVAPDRKIILTGLRSIGFGGASWGSYRLNADGSLDAQLGPGGYSLALQADGKVVSGLASVTRVNVDGTPDPTFKPTQLRAVLEETRALRVQADGKILVAGQFDTIQEHACVLIGRLDSDGQLDLGFDSSGGFDYSVGQPGSAYAVALDREGRILLGGQLPTFRGRSVPPIVRLNGGLSPRLPLSFTQAPGDQKVPTGATVTLSALTGGYPNPVYQWSRDGVPVAGATNASLSLTNVQVGDFGLYAIVASNSFESIQAQAMLDVGVFTQPGSLDITFLVSNPLCTGCISLIQVLRNGNLVVVHDHVVELRSPDGAFKRVLVDDAWGVGLVEQPDGRLVLAVN
jgi:uncharacterized delta-60 repeat protein